MWALHLMDSPVVHWKASKYVASAFLLTPHYQYEVEWWLQPWKSLDLDPILSFLAPYCSRIPLLDLWLLSSWGPWSHQSAWCSLVKRAIAAELSYKIVRALLLSFLSERWSYQTNREKSEGTTTNNSYLAASRTTVSDLFRRQLSRNPWNTIESAESSVSIIFNWTVRQVSD